MLLMGKVCWYSLNMSFYHKEKYYPDSAVGRNQKRSGDSRRGLIPRPETAAEKVQRLREMGYSPFPATPIEFDNKNLFAKYDLGNKELPAYEHKTEIIKALLHNRIILFTGPTGSGKTTQLAQYALEAGFDRVVYLQPRRINADNTGDRIEQELRDQLGEAMPDHLVGIVHSERATHTEESRILSMTSATFSKMLPELSVKWADEKVLIVSDEIHENNLETEFASANAVRATEKNANWRVAFSSATPDSKVLKESYEVINGGPIPTIEIKGRPHSLEMVESPDEDIVEAYLGNSAGIQKSMIFVEGKRAIDTAIKELKKAMTPEERALTKFFKLHADISECAKREIFDMKLKPGEKAVIVSTSAGQSGITIPGLKLVIASGITKSPELDDENAEGLPPRHCTQAEIIQQAGRAGRDVSGGRCVLARPIGFRRYKNQNKELYQFVPLNKREPDMPPEIYHSNISRNVLAAAAMGEDFHELNTYLKNSVKESTIYDSYDILNKLGAVSDDNDRGREEITDLGRIMDLYPLRPELSRAIAETYINTNVGLNIQAYALLIAAAIEAGGLADYDNRNTEWKKVLRPSTDDDFIAQLDMMMATREYFFGKTVDEDYLTREGFSPRRVYRAHRQFNKMCKLIGLNPRDIDLPYPTLDEEDELRGLFLTGMPDLLYRKTATERGVGKYQNVWGNEDVITREISSRSLLSRMGQTAVQIVAGYPRWYLKDNGDQMNIIETGFVTSLAQIKERLGHLASGHLTPGIRNGQLVKTGTAHIGNLPLGQVKVEHYPVQTGEEVRLMVDSLMYGSFVARDRLKGLGVPDSDIRKQAAELAPGVYSAAELDARLWPLVAELEANTGAQL